MDEAERALLARYNYPEFRPQYFEPWMRFDESPGPGEEGADFPLWHFQDGRESSLAREWQRYRFTVVEFGSFT